MWERFIQCGFRSGVVRTFRVVALTIPSLGGMFISPVDVLCQTCGPTYPTTPPNPEGYFSAPSACTVPDGGYVKVGSSLTVDTSGSVTGVCHYCVNGTYLFDMTRYLMGVDTWIYPPTELSSHRFTYAAYHSQTLDTRGGAGMGITVDELGSWGFAFRSTAWATNCDSGTADSNLVNKTISVLQCQPYFLEQAGTTIRLDPLTPPNKIQVFLPLSDPDLSAASTALNAATSAWNAVLPAGVQFQVVNASCGTGARCITVTTASLPTCGEAYREWDTNGTITGNLQLRLHTSWATFSEDGKRRTFIHELGHFLGLDNANKDACGVTDAAMQDQFVCTDTTVMHDVTLNDSLPVVNSSYGPKPKTACGF